MKKCFKLAINSNDFYNLGRFLSFFEEEAIAYFLSTKTLRRTYFPVIRKAQNFVIKITFIVTPPGFNDFLIRI